MNGAAYRTYSCSHRKQAVSRLRRALAVSVFSHLLFSAAPVSEAPRSVARVFEAAPIVVQLEPPSRVTPAGLDVADLDEPPIARRIDRRSAASVSERSAALLPEVSATKPDLAAPLAWPQASDPTVYTARDLDSYPRPVVPLDIGRFWSLSAGIQPAEVRFELLIDEHGVVNEVAPAGPGTAGQPGAELRTALAATRFIPARKDGRAVKSRVQLSINFGAGNRER